jgi:hypothetical protein
MNPNDTIRIWLLACGKQFGIDQAHEYRWPDPSTRPEVMYFTFQSLGGQKNQTGHNDLSSASGYDTTVSGSQSHRQLYRIDLYNSEDGLYELEACCVAAQKSQVIRKLFNDGGCAFVELEGVENKTTFDGDRIDHHFSMTVAFLENVEISLTEVNGIVEQIDLTLEAGDPTYQINRTGITVT